MQIHESEIRRIQKIHFQLASCSSPESLYESGLLAINELLDADHSLFFGISPDKKPISNRAFGFDAVKNIDPLIVEKYYQGFYKIDPFFNYLLDHSKGVTHQLISPLEVLKDDAFHQEPFYQDFIQPYFDNVGKLDHMLCLMLCDNDLPIAIYFFFRLKEKDAFADKDMQILELLVSPLITNVRRIAIEQKVLERDFIISELKQASSVAEPASDCGDLRERYGLTHREIDVSRLVMKGMTNILIADELEVSTRTVENHLRAIYKKLDIHNRTSLASMMRD